MWFRTASIFALLIVAALTIAQPGMFIPAGGIDMPSYFSGTNCRASGSAQVGPVHKAWLFVRHNGQDYEVDYFESDGEWDPLSVALECIFDSSYFPPGDDVTIKLVVKVRNVTPNYELESDPVTIKNRVMMYEIPDPGISPDAAPIVDDLMTNKNYDRSLTNGGIWNAFYYLNNMGLNTNAIFVASHGHTQFHQSGLQSVGNAIWAIAAPTHANSYEAARIEQIGQGIPPFNDGAIPVNFLHLDCCCCGSTNNFIRACYPYYMEWGGPWLEDQAVLGYNVYLPLNQYSDHATDIWTPMVAGETVGIAQADFDNALPGDYLVSLSLDPVILIPMEPNMLRLYGDPYMRIKGVYTGTDIKHPNWWISN